jgi:hypothetical protein
VNGARRFVPRAVTLPEKAARGECVWKRSRTGFGGSNLDGALFFLVRIELTNGALRMDAGA